MHTAIMCRKIFSNLFYTKQSSSTIEATFKSKLKVMTVKVLIKFVQDTSLQDFCRWGVDSYSCV